MPRMLRALVRVKRGLAVASHSLVLFLSKNPHCHRSNGSLRILKVLINTLSSWCPLSPLYSSGQTPESHSNSNRFPLVLRLTLALPPGLNTIPGQASAVSSRIIPGPTDTLYNGLAHEAEPSLTDTLTLRTLVQ